MRIGTRLAGALAGTVLLGACVLSSDDAPAPSGGSGNRLEGLTREHQLDSSLLAFESMKARTGGAYRYRAGFASVFGFGGETWIWIEDGLAVRRTFSSWSLDSVGRKIPETSYEERGDEVGRRQEGHPPVTLDSLYRICREALKEDTATHRLYFSLDDDNILGTCGSVHKLCQDDCPPQVRVEVRWDP